MTPERWRCIRRVFEAALERQPGERARFLDEACAGDAPLRAEVEKLLASDVADDFMEMPAVDVARTMVPDSPAEPQTGRRVGLYRIVRGIGHGGMGAVYLATRDDNEYQKQVAIKLVKRGMDTEAILRRFRHERQILADLDHANIAKLLDGGTTDGLPYFVMDYVEGLPIDVYCDTHRLPTAARLKLFRTVCAAVQHAHEHRVVHRDLKPSNILVTEAGVPKLLDFGIAKVLSSEAAAAPTAESAVTALRPMTPEYASPEQVRGEPITPASDVYSLGVLLYELLTGHRPYRIRSGAPPQEIERVICGGEPERPSVAVGRIEEVPNPQGTDATIITPEAVSQTRDGQPSALRRRLAGDLDNIVLTALRKERERRYASVEQLSEDLRRHVEGLPVAARKVTPWYRTAKFVRRNKASAVAAVVTALIFLALIGWERYGAVRREPVADRPVQSVAVLPFQALVAEEKDASLELGMTDALISKLSGLRHIMVRPTSAVLKYGQAKQDPVAAGRELRVNSVLAGKIQRSGDRIRVTVRLIRTPDGLALWAETFDAPFTDVFAVQDAISQQVSKKLLLKLSGEEQRQLTKRFTEDTEAYQFYMKGLFLFNNQRVKGGMVRSAEYFKQAIEKDPSYALAYAGLADTYTLLALTGALPPEDAYQKAEEAVARALALDDKLAEAHTALATNRMNHWDWATAEREFQRAIQLNPGYATAHMRYAFYFMAIGRAEEGLGETRRAQELDPVSLRINLFMAKLYYHMRRPDQAIAQIRNALELDPNNSDAHRILGHAYEYKREFPQAIAALQKALALWGETPEMVSELAHAYAVSGRRADALKMLEQLLALPKQRYVAPFDIAVVYIGLGEKDSAMAWLEKAYAERSSKLLHLKLGPRFDALRSSPRFGDLLRRMGLPH
jgi:serine/threonine protein kinase/TolB-like protein/Tfp pilus assembly protein PilF